MAHDQFLRDMCLLHSYEDEGFAVEYRPIRPRTRKSGRRVTRTDHVRTWRLKKLAQIARIFNGIERLEIEWHEARE